MFLGLSDLDLDPLVRDTNPDPDLHHQAKIIRKTLIPAAFIFENDVNVPSKSNKQKNFLLTP
jgi:hypothetical protein